jgi:hypothetical protein
MHSPTKEMFVPGLRVDDEAVAAARFAELVPPLKSLNEARVAVAAEFLAQCASEDAGDVPYRPAQTLQMINQVLSPGSRADDFVHPDHQIRLVDALQRISEHLMWKSESQLWAKEIVDAILTNLLEPYFDDGESGMAEWRISVPWLTVASARRHMRTVLVRFRDVASEAEREKYKLDQTMLAFVDDVDDDDDLRESGRVPDKGEPEVHSDT